MKKKLIPFYSGKQSEKFWDVINSLDEMGRNYKFYSLALKLQALEEKVLNEINRVIKFSALVKKGEDIQIVGGPRQFTNKQLRDAVKRVIAERPSDLKFCSAPPSPYDLDAVHKYLRKKK